MFGHEVTEQLHGETERTRGAQHNPHGGAAHRWRHPMMTATMVVAIMGRPDGNRGVTQSAKTNDTTATSRRKFDVRRGHKRPRNAAGTAASSPHAAGLPRAFAPSAPSNVKRFQKRKTPAPVNQNPSRIASVPLGAWESATPVDSSMVRCADATRRAPRTRSSGAIWIP